MSNSDARHFNGLVEPHLDALFRAAFRLARNEEDAQDLVQEACVRAYRHISELDESRHVKAWLLRVLHNVFVDGARRVQRSPVAGFGGSTDHATSSPCADPHPEESTYALQREEQLQRAWSKRRLAMAPSFSVPPIQPPSSIGQTAMQGVVPCSSHMSTHCGAGQAGLSGCGSGVIGRVVMTAE